MLLRLNLLLNILAVYSISVSIYLYIDKDCQLNLALPYYVYIVINMVTNILACLLITIYCYKYANFTDITILDSKIMTIILTIILLLSCLLVYGGRIQIYPSPDCHLIVNLLTSVWITNIFTIVYIAFIIMIYVELAMQNGQYFISYNGNIL